MSLWFRLYDSLLDDPKVQKLFPETFRGWINILCLAKRHDGVLPEIDDIAFALRMDQQAAETLLRELIGAGLVDETENGRIPHNWDARQFQSDNSTERVRRYRKRKRNVSETPSETPPETETETETENIEGAQVAPTTKKKSQRKKGSRIPDNWEPGSDGSTYARQHGLDNPTISLETEKFKNYWLGKTGANATKLDWPATWRTWVLNSLKYNGGSVPASNGASPTPKADTERMLADHRKRMIEKGIMPA